MQVIRHTFLLIAVAALLLATESTNAVTVNVQIRGSGAVLNGTYGTGAGQFLAPAPYTGSTWNRKNASGTNLTDSDGNATTIGFSLSGTASGGSGAATNAWMEALNGYEYRRTATGGPTTMTLSGLTVGQKYDLHIILQGNKNEGGAVTMISGADVLATPSESLGNFGRIASLSSPAVAADSYILGRNFTTQSWVANSTTALFSVVAASSGSQYVAYAGFQLVEVAATSIVPEPATATLGLLAFGGLMMRRRRAA